MDYSSAIIAILHVFVSYFAVGGGLYLIFAEKKGLREKSQEILQFTKVHARFFFTPGDLQVVPEYSPFVFFLITLVAGLICVAWMVRLTASTVSSEQRS